jgi:hypothetical protein
MFPMAGVLSAVCCLVCCPWPYPAPPPERTPEIRQSKHSGATDADAEGAHQWARIEFLLQCGPIARDRWDASCSAFLDL